MPLPLEHSALVIAANVPELERRFRRLAEEISLVASHLADTEPELARLTKLRDEIEFAAKNIEEQSESAEVQSAAATLSSACNGLTDVLFQFRQHHDGSLSADDEPHPLGRDLINDLSDEIGENWDIVVLKANQSIDGLFERLRISAAQLKLIAPNELAPLYDLDLFFATAADSIAALDHKDRFDKVQQEIIPRYRTLFEKCCKVHPRLARHFAESFDDVRFQSEMILQRQIVRDALKEFEHHPNPKQVPQVSNDKSPVAQQHPYVGRILPGHPSGWHDLVKGDVTLYGRRLKLQNKPARLLMRLLLSKKRLSIEDLSCVDTSWQEDLDNNDDVIRARGDNNIRTALSRLRNGLRKQLGIPEDRQKEIIKEIDMQPTVWELNWGLLDEYGFAKGESTQE